MQCPVFIGGNIMNRVYKDKMYLCVGLETHRHVPQMEVDAPLSVLSYFPVRIVSTVRARVFIPVRGSGLI